MISPSKFWTAIIFLHAHLQVVYYNCVKFHKNPISCLGGVALTRYMPSFFSWKYKLNYLPFQILDSDHISSCTSAGSVLQLCKVSQKSNKPFRRSWAYKVHGRTDRQTGWFPYIPPQTLFARGIIIRFYLSLVRSFAYGESEVKLFVWKEIINRWSFSFSKGKKWYDKRFNVKYLPLFHHFKAIYQFPKHIIFWVKIVANDLTSDR